MSSKRGSEALYRGVAELIVKGTGVPRSPAQIVDEVAKALERAHAAGKVDAAPAARLAALREVRCALDGAAAGLDAVSKTVDREIDQLAQPQDTRS